MLQQGDSVPHFTVTDTTGAAVAYGRLWQRKQLVLVRLTDRAGSAWATFLAELEFLRDDDTALVVTQDDIDGIPAAAVVIADRWGEIAFAAHAERDADLPQPDDVRTWVHYVRVKCPECEGEAR